MRIEDEIKLTFDDVLIRPKRSTLVSRSEVQLERTLKFKHTSSTWTGIPIVSANMDTTGTFETAISLQKFKMITAIHKFYSIDDWKNNIDKLNADYIAVTVGQSDEDLELAKQSPVLHLKLTDPTFAAIAYDNISDLQGLEKLFDDFKSIPENVAQGWEKGRLNVRRGKIGTMKLYGNTDENLDFELADINKRLEEYDNKTKPLIIFYENQKKFYSIDGVGSLTDINIRLVVIIDSKCND